MNRQREWISDQISKYNFREFRQRNPEYRFGQAFWVYYMHNEPCNSIFDTYYIEDEVRSREIATKALTDWQREEELIWLYNTDEEYLAAA